MSSATVGRTVLYTLSEYDCEQINKKRELAHSHGHRLNLPGVQLHNGNLAREGDVCAAVVVRTWGEDSHINLSVQLDGEDTYWATSRSEGEGAGHWAWPVRSEA